MQIQTFLKSRIFLLISAVCSILLYLPINRLVQGGVTLNIPLDKYVPIIPVFILPYLLGTVLFILLPIIAWKFFSDKLFYPYIYTTILAALISNLIFVLWPTYVIRPEIVGNDIFSELIRLLYTGDNSHCAAPSGHTFFSLINCIYLIRWQPKYRLGFIAITAAIISATIFTGQHYIMDVIMGLAFGGFMIWLCTKLFVKTA